MARICVRHIKLCMLRTEIRCHLRRVLGFVVSSIVEADGKRLDRAAALRLHQSDYSTRINAAREECTERNIRHHVASDTGSQNTIELGKRALFVDEGTCFAAGHCV